MTRPARSPDRGPLVVCALLTIWTAAVYSRLGEFDFVTYDDTNYVTDNPLVQQGLTAHGLAWAMTTSHAGYWHPVTWLSHMLDCELFGLAAGWHHLVSGGLHIINALLLLGLLRAMTGTLWRSAFVAAVFALHPLHVESVAWIAERKDVLSTTFGLGALWSYAAYARHGGGRRYGLTAMLFLLGLLAKPMLVTLPLLMLLLDYWPLRRVHLGVDRGGAHAPAFPWRRVGALVLEKTPLLLLSVLSSIATLVSVGEWFDTHQAQFHRVPMSSRLPTSLVSVVLYLGKMVWPSKLAVLYPHPGLAGGIPWTPWELGGAAVALIAITVAVLLAHRHRYLLVGWLWYLGLLVPTVGIILVGAQSMADRYTYLSMVGIAIMVAWGTTDLLRRWVRDRSRRLAIARVVPLAVLLPSSLAAHEQTKTWRDSVTLFQHAVDVTGPNINMRIALGMALADKRRFADAIEHFRHALRIKWDDASTHQELARALAATGQWEQATEHFAIACQLRPESADAHYNLGVALLSQGHHQRAQQSLRVALRLEPNHVRALIALAEALQRSGEPNAAQEAAIRAVELDPRSATAHYLLATILTAQGKPEEAWAHLQATLRINPSHAPAHLDVGIALARRGERERAKVHFRRAAAIRPNYAKAHYNLGVAESLDGHHAAARRHFSRALAYAQANGHTQLAAKARKHLAEYERATLDD